MLLPAPALTRLVERLMYSHVLFFLFHLPPSLPRFSFLLLLAVIWRREQATLLATPAELKAKPAEEQAEELETFNQVGDAATAWLTLAGSESSFLCSGIGRDALQRFFSPQAGQHSTVRMPVG